MSGPPQEIIDLFDSYALKLIDSGFKKYSARAIMHRIRWHYHVERGDRDFKCNNNWTPKMARDFQDRHPEHADFFETRRSPGTVPLKNTEPNPRDEVLLQAIKHHWQNEKGN